MATSDRRRYGGTTLVTAVDRENQKRYLIIDNEGFWMEELKIFHPDDDDDVQRYMRVNSM